MFYFALIGILLGMLVVRLSLSNYIFMHSWLESFVSYVFAPIILSTIYSVVESVLNVDFGWEIHIVLGAGIGIIAQFIVFSVRKQYLELLIKKNRLDDDD